MGTEAITSLAILLVNWDEGKEYIDNFVPFVGQCIIALNPEVVSAQELQEKLHRDYGLQVPQNTIKSILKKAEKKGYVQKAGEAYVPNFEALRTLNFETKRQESLRQHNALVQKMQEFADKRYSLSLTTEASEDILFSYIRMHDIELLNCIVTGETLAEAELKMGRKQSYVVQAFVKHIYENDPECSKYLDAIVKGHMLANALILPDLGNARRRFRHTSVYFDTPLILRALGYEGRARQTACKELFDLLKEVGAHVCCFRHTRDEVHSVLYACKMALAEADSTRVPYGAAFHHFSHLRFTPADLELEMAMLNKNIEKLGARIEEKPEYVDKYQVDESRLEETLEALVNYPTGRERARIHDVDCLSAVFRLRKGQSYYTMEECCSLFVTPNNSVCRVNTEFFVGDNYVNQGAIPIAVTDYALTNILWLKRPTSAPTLPRKYIVSECYAAMEPGERLWHKYLDKVKQLNERGDISEDEYYLLRETQLARTELVEITMGDEDVFVEGTPQEILERIRQSIREGDLRELALEKERHEDAERQLRFEQDAAREREQVLNLNIERKSQTVAFFITTFILGIFELALLAGAIYGLVGPEFTWSNLTLSILGIIFVLISAYNLFFGTMVKEWRNRFQSWFARHIQRLLASLFMPTE
jgi:hypothetical protein